MNYDLAKRLKDAGFNQHEIGVFNGRPSYDPGAPYDFDRKSGEQFYIPNLSELVDAIGGVLLWGCKDHGYFASKQFCPIENKTPESVIDADTHGETPEETLAELWLKLHEKI